MTVAVESVMSPEGEPSVGMTVHDQMRRWLKRSPTTVYLTQQEARQLAGTILEASGVHFATVLEEEAERLRQSLEASDLDRDQVAHLRMCQAVVRLLQRVLVP